MPYEVFKYEVPKRDDCTLYADKEGRTSLNVVALQTFAKIAQRYELHVDRERKRLAIEIVANGKYTFSKNGHLPGAQQALKSLEVAFPIKLSFEPEPEIGANAFRISLNGKVQTSALEHPKEPAAAYGKAETNGKGGGEQVPSVKPGAIERFLKSKTLPAAIAPQVFLAVIADRSTGKMDAKALAKKHGLPTHCGSILRSADGYIKFYNDLTLDEDRKAFSQLLKEKCKVSNGGGQSQVTNSGADHLLSPETLASLRERKAGME